MENINKFLQNIQPRDYQIQIYQTCKGKNCLVVLPTGIGKTLIALMLAIDRLTKFPDNKVLFLAPTRPLAEQHLNYFKKHLPELFATMELFTGKVDAEKRKQLWQSADIVFSTPQCVSNDVKNALYDLKEVSLLIEDECHRCLKNYAYTYAAENYLKTAKNPRVLGLTASPGAEKSKIREICKNLGIEDVEIRTRESEDVKHYLQELEFDVVKVDFPEEFEKIMQLLKIIYNKKVEELKNRKLLFAPATKKNLLELQHRIMTSITKGNKNFNMLSGASACAQTIKLGHALELLQTQTLSSMQNYMQELFDQAAKKKSKAVQQLIKQPEFNQAYVKMVELIARKVEHPKLAKLKEIVEQDIKTNPRAKIIVFAQYRDTLVKICKTMNEISGINAKVFVGQAKKGKTGEETGLSQKEQQELIREFSLGKINILCASSVHPDEYIILKKEGKIMVKKIGEFVDFYIKKESIKTISKKILGWEVLTSDGKNILFKPVTFIHKHPIQNGLIRLKLSSGFDCFVTENHSLFSFNSKNKFIPAAPEKNKFIALALKCPNIEQNKKIDIIKEIYENCSKKEIKNLFGNLLRLTQAKMRILKTDLSILSVLEKNRLSILEIAKLSKKDYSAVMDCLKRLKEQEFIKQKRENKNYKNISETTSKGEAYLRFLRWFFNNIRYKKGKYRFKICSTLNNLEAFNDFFEQNINVNYGKTKFPRFIDINESLARFLGFYVSEGSARKTKYTSDIFLAARVKKMQIMMEESIKNGLKLKIRKNWRGIAIDSQIAYHLIKSVFKAGIGAYNKEVPEIIFTSSSKIKWEFLRAYFLGDGHSNGERIVFTTVSRKLVIGLVLLLRMLGVNKLTLHQQKHIYKLNISESLPFAKLKEKNEKRGHAYYNLIPNAIKSKKAFEKYKNFFSFSPNNRMKCRKNGNWESDTCFDYIKKIESIEKPKYVYDLSVKDTENFIGGTGLFCLHNSIGEEGLDIPEVNAVIFYEPIPSAIRKIQRAGRTARLVKGKLIILLTKKTLDEAYYWAAFHKEKRMYSAIKGLKEEMKGINNDEGKDNNGEKIIEKDKGEKEAQKTLL